MRVNTKYMNSARGTFSRHINFTAGCSRPCQVRVTVGDSGLCCCVCVTFFERRLTPLFVDSAQALWVSFYFRLPLFNPFHCHDVTDLKTTSKRVKFPVLKHFCFLFHITRERVGTKLHGTESTFVIGPGNYTVCRCVRALFSR